MNKNIFERGSDANIKLLLGGTVIDKSKRVQFEKVHILLDYSKNEVVNLKDCLI